MVECRSPSLCTTKRSSSESESIEESDDSDELEWVDSLAAGTKVGKSESVLSLRSAEDLLAIGTGG